jgi:hypothetical protein
VHRHTRSTSQPAIAPAFDSKYIFRLRNQSLLCQSSLTLSNYTSIRMSLTGFPVVMPPSPSSPQLSPSTSIASTFFTTFPRELREEIYSYVLVTLPPSFHASSARAGTLPYLTAPLPPSLCANKQMVVEAITSYLARTQLVVPDTTMLDTVLAGAEKNVIRHLAIEETFHSAQDVQQIFTKCPRLVSLTLTIPGRMVLQRHQRVPQRPFGSLSHVFQGAMLRSLSVVCNDGDVYYYPDLGIEFRDAFQVWAADFVEQVGGAIEVAVRINPTKGYKSRAERVWYTVGRVSMYTYYDFFG